MKNNKMRDLQKKIEAKKTEIKEAGDDTKTVATLQTELEGLNEQFQQEAVNLESKVNKLGAEVTGLTGKTKELGELISGAVSSGSASVLIPTELSAELIDKARAQAVAIQAGVRIIPMNTQGLTMARKTEDVQSNWKAEGAKIETSEAQFDGVTFEACSLWALTKLSVELIEDAQNIEEILVNSIAESIALKIDECVFFGKGTTGPDSNGVVRRVEPLGLYYRDNVPKTDVNAPIENFSIIAKAIRDVRKENYEPNYQLMHPALHSEFDLLVDADGNPMRRPQSVFNLPELTSTMITPNVAVVGQFNQCAIGLRQSIRLEISREAGDAFTHGMVAIRAYMRMDFQPLQEKAFMILDNIELS